MLWDRAFLSEQQANYLYASINSTVGLKYEKLLVKGRNNPREVKDVSSALLALSPEHTELSEVSFVEASFSILQTYLEWFITVLSVVMNSLSVLLLFLYTRNKCREELEMYRILRAVGTPVLRLRIMIFCEVFVRVVISVLIGIVMGIIFSVAFANQVEALLMVKMPAIELGLIAVMAAVLLLIFSGTVIYSTKDLERMTVAQMARG